MNRNSKTIRSGGTFSAGKRIGVSNQPLNKMPAIKMKYLVLAILFVSMGVLVFQNKQSISQRMSQPITKVRVENQWQSISEAEVQKEIGRFMGVGYFDFDVNGVREVLENHPWIRHAAVKKVWPDSVGLQLVEEVAIARWDKDALLNQYGETFKPLHIEHLSTLPLLIGPDNSQVKVMEQYRAINQLFFQAGMRVTSLELSERGNWKLKLNEQVEINAGRVDVMQRLDRFIEFYGNQDAETIAGIVAADLRYENGIAIRSHGDDLSAVAAR